jgi:hypothetical protein
MAKTQASWIVFGIGDTKPDFYIKPGKLSRKLRDRRDTEPANTVEALEARIAEIAIDISEVRPLRVVSVVPSVDRYANTSSQDFAIRTDFDSKLIVPKLWPPRE